jgi:hypothetical protein
MFAMRAGIKVGQFDDARETLVPSGVIVLEADLQSMVLKPARSG